MTINGKAFRAGKFEDLPVGKFKIIDMDGKEVGLLRFADGEVHAVRNMCPHKVAPICRGHLGGTWPPSEPGELKYCKDGEMLVCRRAMVGNSTFASGKELYQDQPARLLKYDVAIEDGEVMIMRRSATAVGVRKTGSRIRPDTA